MYNFYGLKKGPSVNSLHWTLFTLLFFLSLGQSKSLLLLAAFLFCLSSVLFFFSKDSDASGLAPTLSINQFKSNKCGIFSRTGVHSPCLCKAVL